jgi:hypothetical protein
MKIRFLTNMSMMLLAVLAVLLLVPPAIAGPADEEAGTEDILYMVDGRVLHGQILEETRLEVVRPTMRTCPLSTSFP